MAEPGDFLREKHAPGDNAGESLANAREESRGSVCRFYGKPSRPRGLRYAIYCPACGTLNYLDSRIDYYRGCCAECGSPFRLAEEKNPTVFRKVAYPVFAAVLSACICMLFFSGGGNFRAHHGLTFPVPAGGHVVQAVENPAAWAAGKVKEFPLPMAPVPPEKSSLPAAPVFPKASPSSAVHVLKVEAAAGGPAVSRGGTAAKAFAKKPVEAEKSGPQARAKSGENHDKLIERVLREKSTGPREKVGNLLEIPFPDSESEQK